MAGDRSRQRVIGVWWVTGVWWMRAAGGVVCVIGIKCLWLLLEAE